MTEKGFDEPVNRVRSALVFFTSDKNITSVKNVRHSLSEFVINLVVINGNEVYGLLFSLPIFYGSGSKLFNLANELRATFMRIGENGNLNELTTINLAQKRDFFFALKLSNNEGRAEEGGFTGVFRIQLWL